MGTILWYARDMRKSRASVKFITSNSIIFHMRLALTYVADVAFSWRFNILYSGSVHAIDTKVVLVVKIVKLQF